MSRAQLIATLSAVSALGLAGISAGHVVCAAGSSWPARSERILAESVVSADRMPPPAASALVALGLAGATLCVAGVGGQTSVAVTARRVIGAGLLARGLMSSRMATRMVLGLSEPGPRFRRLDSLLYRPLCLVLAAATLLSARR